MSREAFEEYARGKKLPLITGITGGYVYADTAAAWEAWQAALSQQAGEAVAVIDEHVQGSPYVRWLRTPPDAGTNLYTSPPPAVPEEWKLVPKVASQEMLEEGVFSMRQTMQSCMNNWGQVASNLWEDMLAAAPESQR